jgi:hypothetical protein
MSISRREFVKAATALALAHESVAAAANSSRLRIGVIGTGLRGQQHLSLLLRRADVEVTALCDIERYMLETSLKMIATAGKLKPRIYTGSPNAWKQMLRSGMLDAVIIATPWELHAPQAIAAMEAKVAVGCEVVAGISLEDHWAVLRAQQRTGTPYMLLENVCYRRDVLAVLNMVRQGLFGEIVHLQGGYEHDLREVKLNSGVPGKPYGEGVPYIPSAVTAISTLVTASVLARCGRTSTAATASFGSPVTPVNQGGCTIISSGTGVPTMPTRRSSSPLVTWSPHKLRVGMARRSC